MYPHFASLIDDPIDDDRAVFHHVLTDLAKAPDADRKILALLWSYAKQSGGINNVTDFLQRVREDALTDKDKERLRDIYFPSRRAAIASGTLVLSVFALVASAASSAFCEQKAQDGQLPAAERAEYKKLRKKADDAFVGSLSSTCVLIPITLRIKNEEIEAVENSPAYAAKIRELADDLSPAMQAVAQKLHAFSHGRA